MKKENRLSTLRTVILGIALGVVAVAGYKYYQNSFPYTDFVMSERDGVEVRFLNVPDGDSNGDLAYVFDHGQKIGVITLGYDDVLDVAKVSDDEVYLLYHNSERPGNDGEFYVIDRHNAAMKFESFHRRYWTTTENNDLVFTADHVSPDPNYVVVAVGDMYKGHEYGLDGTNVSGMYYPTVVSASGKYIAVVAEDGVRDRYDEKAFHGQVFLIDQTIQTVNGVDVQKEVRNIGMVTQPQPEDGPFIPFADGTFTWTDKAVTFTIGDSSVTANLE
jgi:hypothetical protein